MSDNDESTIHWSYDYPCEWSKQFPCANGLCQSPIDIDAIDTIPQMYSPFVFSSKYNADRLFTLNNTGQQIIATLAKSTDEHKPNELWFSGGGLPGMFHFVNFHLHWGRTNKHGSEHEINGHRFPAEAHFVHTNYENGQIAVLALFLTIADVDNHEHNAWGRYAEVASRLIKLHDLTNCTFNLSQMMQIDDKDFFRYIGSLTTPPCTEGIIWTIFPRQISIREQSLNLLRQNLMRNAHRPVQPINGRTIFRNYYDAKMI